MKRKPAPVPGETRDWTFVLHGGCEQCGYEPHDPVETLERLTAAASRWSHVLSRADASQRPSPLVWSPVEYACHVRDMLRLLTSRVQAMISRDDPQFQNWDGDQKAVEFNYWAAQPRSTAADIDEHVSEAIETLAGLAPEDWGRPGHRSDGVLFTVATLCQFTVHDVEHHLNDVHG